MVLAVILAHAPFVRAAVLARLRNRIEAAGVRLDADRLSYNLLTLNASLDRVTLAAVDSATPFLQADAIRVKLPWSALWGALTIESIEVDRPRLVIVRDDAGSTNLPAFQGGAGGGPSTVGPVTIGRLLVRDLAVRYTDASNRSALTASGVTLDLRATGGPRLAGTLTASRPIDLQRGDRRTTVDRLEGRLAFDGRTLNVESFDAHAPELGVHLDGHVDLLTGDPRAALRYEADVAVDRAAPWAGLDSPAPSGVLKLSGAVDGPIEAPTVTVNLASDALVWPGLGELSLEGRGTVTSSTVNVESFRVTAAGGEADGEARVSLEAAGSSEVRTRWHDLNLGVVARAFPAVPVRLASLASGDAVFAWTGDAVIDGHGRAALTLRAPAAASRALALSGRLEAQLADRQWRVEATSRSRWRSVNDRLGRGPARAGPRDLDGCRPGTIRGRQRPGRPGPSCGGGPADCRRRDRVPARCGHRAARRRQRDRGRATRGGNIGADRPAVRPGGPRHRHGHVRCHARATGGRFHARRGRLRCHHRPWERRVASRDGDGRGDRKPAGAGGALGLAAGPVATAGRGGLHGQRRRSPRRSSRRHGRDGAWNSGRGPDGRRAPLTRHDRGRRRDRRGAGGRSG